MVDIIAESSSSLCLLLGLIFSPYCKISLFFRLWKYVVVRRCRHSTKCFFFSPSDGYLAENVVHLNICSSVISDQESSVYEMTMCIIASAIHYACRHTPRLKQCLQQESLAACQPWLMWSPSKTGEIHQRNFQEKGYQEHNCSEWGHCRISYRFHHLSQIIPDALSHKNYETFLSWGNCFYSNLILLVSLLSQHLKCVCVCVCVCVCLCVSHKSADTTEYSATPLRPNTRW